MKKTILLSLVFVLSLSANLAQANEITSDFLKQEIELAYNHYLNAEPQSGLFALETLARLIESDSTAILLSEVGPNTLCFTYVRIGLLHEKLGNQEQAAIAFSQAIKSNSGNAELSVLKASVLKLDEKAA
ncbi:hypothetical protein [Pseudoalteromonas tunicata]|uniref:hypothetical protein n=1 Tax=Pseudoalteromonas tunicata TaxID=314281 RepID=UPI00273FA458|nr:hypothetical protein [Pseudoalteromonas tunicata]MDP4985190.1 hypothetical protein [Pseudoalteromonas tunicata]